MTRSSTGFIHLNLDQAIFGIVVISDKRKGLRQDTIVNHVLFRSYSEST